VAVLASEAAPDGFDARRDARSRTYRYRVHTRNEPSPFEQKRALWWPRPLDRAALDACAAALIGTHDFTAFTPTDTDHVRFERDVFRAEWVEEPGEVLAFWIEADTFMRHMVRIIVGTMLEGMAPHRFARSWRGARGARRGRRPRRTGSTSRASHTLERAQMRVLLTNDDGITATGLNVMRRALLELSDVSLEVIAPDSNRSADGPRGDPPRPDLGEEVEFGDGTIWLRHRRHAVDCVRFAALA
jgi:tRNA pseudouridine38-40 synthase